MDWSVVYYSNNLQLNMEQLHNKLISHSYYAQFINNNNNNNIYIYIYIYIYIDRVNNNKATRSPEISREQVQKLTPQFLLYIYWI